MSIDNFIWVPAGARIDKNITYNKFKSQAEMLAYDGLADTPHQVLLAQGANVLVDEQYFFEDVDDARWFWVEGYRAQLYLNAEGTPVPYDRMALWIDDEEIARREPYLPESSEKNEQGKGQVDAERIKRCIAHFLVGPEPGVIQADVLYYMLDLLEDSQLLTLDGMIHLLA